jgi:hypothetical protein
MLEVTGSATETSRKSRSGSEGEKKATLWSDVKLQELNPLLDLAGASVVRGSAFLRHSSKWDLWFFDHVIG